MGDHKPTPPGSHIVRPRTARRPRVFWLGRATPGTGDLKQVSESPTTKVPTPPAPTPLGTDNTPTAQGPTVDERIHDSFARRLETITPPAREPTHSAVRPLGHRGRVEVPVVVPSSAPTIASPVVRTTPIEGPLPGAKLQPKVVLVEPERAESMMRRLETMPATTKTTKTGAAPITSLSSDSPLRAPPSELNPDIAHLLEPTGKFQMLRERFARDPVLMILVILGLTLLLVLCTLVGILVFRHR